MLNKMINLFKSYYNYLKKIIYTYRNIILRIDVSYLCPVYKWEYTAY